ncbi:hypothetical protein D3C80_1066470 [compost metagenome]
MPHPLDCGVLLMGQGIEGFKRVVHLLLRNNAIGPGTVMTGLSLQHIGTVSQAQLQALLCQVQLTLEGGFLGLACSESVLGFKQAEIHLGAVEYQLLLGNLQLQQCLLMLGLGSLEVEPAIDAQYGLVK